MTDLEMLTQIADDRGLQVARRPLSQATKGLIMGDRIILRSDLTTAEAADTLAEEIAHDLLTVGDISDQTKTGNRKQEHRARALTHEIRIGLRGIVRCYEAGCRSLYEAAELLEVSEELLTEALERYRQQYGRCVQYEQYVIYFEPMLAIFKRR